MPESLQSLFGAEGPACVLALLLAAALTWVAALPVRRLAFRLGAIDMPGGRRIHLQPTPRLGGLAVLAGVAVAVPVGLLAAQLGLDQADRLRAALPILLLAAFVCALGARDDVRPLGAGAKLLGLVLAGAGLVAVGVRIDYLQLPGLGRIDCGLWSGPATICWVLACTNAMNLIDGVDGGSSGVATVSAAGLALVALATGDAVSAVAFSATCGAAAGFLLHNRQPARIFLGDSGSLLLGFLLAASSAASCTKRATALSVVAATLVLAVPFLDTTQSFLRRFRRALGNGAGAGLRPRRVLHALGATAVADRGHIHHRLLFQGLSHRQVARVLGLSTALMAAIALLLLPSEVAGRMPIAGGLAAACYVLWRLASVQDATTLPAVPPVAAHPLRVHVSWRSDLKPEPTPAERSVVLTAAVPRRAAAGIDELPAPAASASGHGDDS